MDSFNSSEFRLAVRLANEAMDNLNLSPLAESDSEDFLDRLSELPDSLILMILSFLDNAEDVVRTTLLSKRWKGLWTTVPCLHFQIHEDTNLPQLRRLVDVALSQWKDAKALKFTLTLTPLYFHDEPLVERIDMWFLSLIDYEVAQCFFDLVGFAIEKQVEELFFNLVGMRCDIQGRKSEYFVPQRLFLGS